MSKIIKSLGVKNFDDLKRIDYPMTRKHDNFMRQITNGNIREIFDIAYESLKYIFENFETLSEREEDGIVRKIIGRDGVMRIFYDNNNSKYKIININKYKSKKKNSLLYNVLETIKISRMLDENFYSVLSKYGHNKKQVDWAIEFLSEKNNRFIQPLNSCHPTWRVELIYIRNTN